MHECRLHANMSLDVPNVSKRKVGDQVRERVLPDPVLPNTPKSATLINGGDQRRRAIRAATEQTQPRLVSALASRSRKGQHHQ